MDNNDKKHKINTSQNMFKLEIEILLPCINS